MRTDIYVHRGRVRDLKAFPNHTTEQLKALVKEKDIPENTKARMLEEIRAREAGESVHKPVPFSQKGTPQFKVGRL